MDPSLFKELRCVFQEAGWSYDGLTTNVGSGVTRACWSAFGWVAEAWGGKVQLRRRDGERLHKEFSATDPNLVERLAKAALE